MRNLVLILGDQLNRDSAAFDDFNPDQDMVWMVEVADESTYVWSHKARITLFLSAMRHFRDELIDEGITVHYRSLDDADDCDGFGCQLKLTVEQNQPERIIIVEPGEWRVKQLLVEATEELEADLEIREDRHFICSHEEFEQHAKGRKQLRLEYFYREWRKKLGVLMEGKDPIGGSWNYDSDNRGSFSKSGPQDLPETIQFSPDEITHHVIDLVSSKFSKHPGSLKHFDWPVNRDDALAALDDFIDNRLHMFGEYQDAMWTDEPFLYHSRIAAALNLKLLNPREVIESAEAAYQNGQAPLNAVEGFIRQILGWREYVRGIYWKYMPDYIEKNALNANQPLPDFYWTGETEMKCLSQAISQTLEYGYAHHIQRLMVTGLFTLLLGVDPKAVHEWYLAVYVDAVEWVELPNSLGMSQFADGGIMASKPYVATGKYIQRMSNYCSGCKYDPSTATGETACPFTTLYWDFLVRHRQQLTTNSRMSLQLRNIDRKDQNELAEIRSQAEAIHQNPEKF